MLGADYQLTRKISLFAEQEFTWGEQEDTEGTRVGLNATPWKGGEVRTSVERYNVENAERVFALFGVGQVWQVTQKWSVDLSIDRSYTVKNEPAGERVNGNVPTGQRRRRRFHSRIGQAPPIALKDGRGGTAWKRARGTVRTRLESAPAWLADLQEGVAVLRPFDGLHQQFARRQRQ